MNVDTGHLIKFLAPEYVPVPKKLVREAEKALAGRDETIIDLKADPPLANWAARERTKRKKNRK